MKNTTFARLLGTLLMCTSLLVSAADQPQPDSPVNKIEKLDFATLPGGKVSVKLVMGRPVKAAPAAFTVNAPPRIVLDFPDTANATQKTAFSVNQGVISNVNLVQTKDRTRLVMNLSRPSAYNTTVSGNEVTIVLQSSDTSSVSNTSVTRFAESKLSDQRHEVKNVDFVRGRNGEGRVIVDLSDANTGIDIRQQGKNIVIDFINADVAANLERRLNVINFNTPVLHVDTMKQGKNTRMVIEPNGKWEHASYQADKRFIVDVKPIVEDPNKLVQGSKTGYSGEKLSLNFQNIEVRSVLQVIADFTGFNIITSDSVNGSLTLRLKDVPWDQAMDIIMQTKGLSMRKTGNVIWVAPSEELAAKEKLALEASQQIEELEPMYTEVFPIKYHKADAVRVIISDPKQKIMSKRGNAVIDTRTNTLFVQDTARHIGEVRRMINLIDIPVRQVLIESRIVIADDGYSKELGARFGVVKNDRLSGSDRIENTSGGATSRSIASNYETARTGTTLTPNDLNVNLPATNPNAGSLGLTLWRFSSGLLINLELSAAEADSRSKTISSPRLITANQTKATIDSGVEIPYQQASSSGATNVSFKKATLTLDVTPQITPDDKINMDLEVSKDSVGEVFNGVPSINTRRIKTQVLVDNGETAVLGGIYEETKTDGVDKVPFFGDLPVLGNLFKRTLNTNDKTELLIFITPKILQEGNI